MPSLPLLALADDLSGAAETAAAIATGERTEILLVATLTGSAPVTCLDLDTRHRTAAEAGAAIRSALRAWPGRLVVKKVDSILRGNLAAEVRALHDAPLVVATALPEFGRTVRRGVVHLAGEPLHRTTAWAAEATAPPPAITAALGATPSTVVDLATVRSDRLAAVLADQTAAGRVPICDADTDADLDAIVAAALTITDCRLVGSGGLAAALGRSLSPSAEGSPIQREGSDAPVLVVVGTSAPIAAQQIDRLVGAGAHHIPLRASHLRPLNHLDHEVTVVSLEPPTTHDPAHARRTARALAEVVVTATGDRPIRLVLTGGETARCVLDAAGIARLVPVRTIHHGAVECRTIDGRAVVIRPGSFGDVDSLVDIVTALTTDPKGARAH